MCDKEYICFSEALRTIGNVNKYECVMNSMVSVNVSKHDKPYALCHDCIGTLNNPISKKL